MSKDATNIDSAVSVTDRTLAVLLAAGGGSRFLGDEHKLRSVVGDRPVLVHSLSAVLDAGYDGVVVVVGDDDFADLLPPDVAVLVSPNWAAGQSHSVQAAATLAADQGYDSMVIGLADQPLVGTQTWVSPVSYTHLTLPTIYSV